MKDMDFDVGHNTRRPVEICLNFEPGCLWVDMGLLINYESLHFLKLCILILTE